MENQFTKISFQATNLLQKANLNKNLLYKADLNEKKCKTINQKNYKKELKPYIKMDNKIINFDDTEIDEYEF